MYNDFLKLIEVPTVQNLFILNFTLYILHFPYVCIPSPFSDIIIRLYPYSIRYQ